MKYFNNISSVTCRMANRIWIASMRKGYHRFCRSLRNTQETQETYLAGLIKNNSNTQYGIMHDFGKIRSARDFQNQLPLTKYDDYLPYIEQIKNGNNNILTGDNIILLEPSSGSTSASKLIPYTKSLKDDFNAGIHPWMYNLYRNNPRLFNGKSFWSISPAMPGVQTDSKVKIGFDNDSEYLGTIGRFFYNRISAVPDDIASIQNLEIMRIKTLAHLLLAEDLVLISVWNPTYMTLMLGHLHTHKVEIFNELTKLSTKENIHRIRKIETLFGNKNSSFLDIWPNLAIISCWTDGTCNLYVEQLKSRFPGIKIQPKGLIATEAFVSLPFIEGCDPVLAVNSHFFEFIDETNGEILLAHQLKTGRTYSVIISTAGGLYRYQLEDIIEVTGHLETAPTFRFISKANHISDQFGEKLNEHHVQTCLNTIIQKYKLNPEFYMLAPHHDEYKRTFYCLYLQDNNYNTDHNKKMINSLDILLRENFHYDYCRRLNQLQSPELFIIPSNAVNIYQKEMLNRNIRCGNIKPTCLDKTANWHHVFNKSE